MFVMLSYKLDREYVGWPGSPLMQTTPVKQVGPEWDCNTFTYSLSNHFGTHMDAPAHFTTRPLALADLPQRYFGYEGSEVCLLDIPKGEGEGVEKADLAPFGDKIGGCRLLLVRTGFGAQKLANPDAYQNRGPYFTAEACRWLNESFPGLDCLGLDFLSLGTPANNEATEAHRWLLGHYTEHYICIIEDMCLSALENRPIRCLTVGPQRVVGVDSCQVSPMAWVE